MWLVSLQRMRERDTGRKTPHGDTGPERRQPRGDRGRGGN